MADKKKKEVLDIIEKVNAALEPGMTREEAYKVVSTFTNDACLIERILQDFGV